MLINHNQVHYTILEDGSHTPYKLNKKKTDEAVKTINEALEAIQSTMEYLYEEQSDIYRLICDEVFEPAMISFDEGGNGHLRDSLDNVRELQKNLLTRQDEVMPAENYEDLEDLGFRKSYALHENDMQFWEKILEDNQEREVVEEVIINPETGVILHRTRTTDWEKTEYGRSSKSIVYKKLRVTKRILNAIKNSMTR